MNECLIIHCHHIRSYCQQYFFFGNGFDLCRPSIGKLTRRNDKEKIGKFIADNVTMSLDVRAYDSR